MLVDLAVFTDRKFCECGIEGEQSEAALIEAYAQNMCVGGTDGGDHFIQFRIVARCALNKSMRERQTTQ